MNALSRHMRGSDLPPPTEAQIAFVESLARAAEARDYAAALACTGKDRGSDERPKR